jgi:hypothetical protein
MTSLTMIRLFSTTLRRRAGLATLLGLTLLQGCAMPGTLGSRDAVKPDSAKAAGPAPAPTAAVTDTKPAPPTETPEVLAQQAVTAGVEAYNRGEYQGAIRRLTAPEIAAGEKPVQLNALKYAAFSYCLTKRQTLCRQQFDKAFKLDPAFDLAPGEKGHPLWTPAFEQAKRMNHPKRLKSRTHPKAPAKTDS